MHAACVLLPCLPVSRLQTEVQAALVKASMADVRQRDEECAAVKEAAAERDTAIRAATSRRDAAARFLNQRLQRWAGGGLAGGRAALLALLVFRWEAPRRLRSTYLACCCGVMPACPAAHLPACLPACLPAGWAR